MLTVRLADGRFSWPRNEDEARMLSGEEFLRLMQGFTIDPSVGAEHKPPAEKTAKQIRRDTIKKLSEKHG